MDLWLSSPEIWKKWVSMKALCVSYFLGREQGVKSLGCTFSMTLNWFPLMGGGTSRCSCRPHCVCPTGDPLGVLFGLGTTHWCQGPSKYPDSLKTSGGTVSGDCPCSATEISVLCLYKGI